jgi:hypothetical protein
MLPKMHLTTAKITFSPSVQIAILLILLSHHSDEDTNKSQRNAEPHPLVGPAPGSGDASSFKPTFYFSYSQKLCLISMHLKLESKSCPDSELSNIV